MVSGTLERRGAERRAKAMRFRFDVSDEEHRAVTVNVSASGAFLKASYVPEHGSIVTVREAIPGRLDTPVHVRGEVVWVIPEPSLARPEPGFGLRFIEAWSAAGPEPVRGFLEALAPRLVGSGLSTELANLDGREVHVYAFPDLEGQAAPEPAGDQEVDLAKELARLDREQGRDPSDAPRRKGRRRAMTGARYVRPRGAGFDGRPTGTERRGAGSVRAESIYGDPPRGGGDQAGAPRPPRDTGQRRPSGPQAVSPVQGARSAAGAASGPHHGGPPGGGPPGGGPPGGGPLGGGPPGADSRPHGGATRPPPSQPAGQPPAPGPPGGWGAAGRPPGAPPQSRSRGPQGGPESRPAPGASPSAPQPAQPLGELASGSAGDVGPRKRRLTGIFTALFARGRDEGDALEGPDIGSTSRGDSDVWSDGDGPGLAAEEQWSDGLVTVTWKDDTAEAYIDKITESMVSLVTRDEVPLYYERVTLVPAPGSKRSAEFVMFGTVTRIKDPDINGDQAFSVRFTKVDERGRSGIFQEYVKAVSEGDGL